MGSDYPKVAGIMRRDREFLAAAHAWPHKQASNQLLRKPSLKLNIRARTCSGIEQSPAEVLFHASASGEGGPKSTMGSIAITEPDGSKAFALFLTKVKGKEPKTYIEVK